jgi:acyl-CoA thioester hydrolase
VATDSNGTIVDPLSRAPYTAYRTAVRPEWIDYNGHMNDAAYAQVLTDANEQFLDALGLSADYRDETGCGLYTVETHIRFLREVSGSDILAAQTLLVEHDAKRVRLHTTLVDEATYEAVATGESLYLNVDQAAGKVTPVPDDRAGTLARVQQVHDALDRPSHLGAGVAAPRR